MIFTQRIDSEYRDQHRSERIDDQEETLIGRALRVGLAAHERSRGPLSARERRWVQASIARSFIQRAAEHRLLSRGQGRRGAWRDSVRAWRANAGTVLSSHGFVVSVGVLLLPSWVLDAANRLLRVEVVANGGTCGARPAGTGAWSRRRPKALRLASLRGFGSSATVLISRRSFGGSASSALRTASRWHRAPPTIRMPSAGCCRAAGVGVLLSERKAHRVSTKEALALGRPLMIADTSGLGELAAHSQLAK